MVVEDKHSLDFLVMLELVTDASLYSEWLHGSMLQYTQEPVGLNITENGCENKTLAGRPYRMTKDL